MAEYTAAVEIQNVSLIYHSLEGGETEALRNISFTVKPREFVSIVGPSGCGKSTLLSLIAGLLRPTSGTVQVEGNKVEGPSPKVGYMLQQDYLFPWRTVLENALIGLEVMGQKDRASVERVRELLTSYGLEGFEDHYPGQLSGGMRQRVALVRTLATNPDICLLDEPFAALDYQTRLFIEEEVGRILRESAKTVLLVTHDISEAVAMSDRVIVLSKRPSVVVNEHKIDLGLENWSALAARNEAAQFKTYFRDIWKELDVHA
ncbi:MAG: ABC transporter ATP-binding protein [Firmicutes bacterium]|nr:ABC transporter ATP-binding protein [Bacillota bacterium]